ncbi:hypothetical protein SAY86_020778 [Trapa natans]|uniref:F-box domain-containing protein n=1 Tax=Trapa natans TaxID=22666 RepID=A0AAN7M917_TRANT|nr:hypothetical protein SAY86_020778 [Trapa natans]
MEEISATESVVTTKEADPSFFHIDDIWTEILLRIPAKDLVKLKAVCKSWYKLINSQSFARSHVDHWRSQCTNCCAIRADCTIDGYTASSILYFSLHHSREKEWEFQLHDLLIRNCYPYMIETESLEELELLASCDGLLLIGCTVNAFCQLLICNPITRSYRRLPLFQPPLDLFFKFESDILKQYDWAMGQNHSTGRYKVFGMCKYPHYLQRICHIVELQRDSEELSCLDWKQLDAPLPNIWLIQSSTAADGKVHWIAATDEQPAQVSILSVDISTDRFSTSAAIMALPETDLEATWNGAFYCTRMQGNEQRIWALENFSKPTWVAKAGSFCYDPDSCWDETISRQFILPGGTKVAVDIDSWYNDAVIALDTDLGCRSNLVICWDAERVVHHINSLVDFS